VDRRKARSFSTSHRTENSNSQNVVHALPFSISPQQALDKFREWSRVDQGLTWLLEPRNVRIAAAYCPVWSFDVNLRYVRERPNETVVGWKPTAFEGAFGAQPGPIHLPGLSSYAGYAYRRSLVNPVHSTSLVFLGDRTVPFGAWMLRDMDYFDERGQRTSLPVSADVWNATKARAFAIVRNDLAELARIEVAQEHQEPSIVRLQTQVVSSRRVYMPTYVVTYQVLGVEYEAFASGCDQGADVSGESHQVLSSDLASTTSATSASASDWLARALGVAQRVAGGAGTVVGVRGLAVAVIQVLGGLVSRLLVRLPLIGFLAGTFVGFRKIVRPKYQRYVGSVEWQRQREHEMYEKMELHVDDFIDATGAAQRYFYRHRRRILASLSGEKQHTQGMYDWYKEWEEWARQMWQQQQKQQQQYSEQQREQYTRTTSSSGRAQRTRAPPEFQWDFDPNDPYSVLGIRRGATKSEVSAAYRTQILKWHPDRQAGSTEAEKLRASERAKLINEAYRKIRLDIK
jgi:DnaJ-domain-containing protein 1